MNILVHCISVVPELFSAIGTEQKVTEDAFRAIFFLRCPTLDRAKHFLYLIVWGTVNDWFMYILEDYPVLRRIIDASVILEGFGACLEVYDIPAILLPTKNTWNGWAFPFVWIRLYLFPTPVDAFGCPIGSAVEMAFFLHHACYGINTFTFKKKLENLLYNKRRLRVDDPLLFVLRILHISVGRLGEWLSRLSSDIVCRAYFTADVTGVELIHNISERGQLCTFIHTGCRVHAIIYCDETDIVVGKILFGVVANL